MKTKNAVVVYSRSIMLTVLIGLSTSIRAADVTGDRLQIGVSNGTSHSLTGTGATIAGGDLNRINANYAAIGGGVKNTNTAAYSVIAGGSSNLVTDVSSFIGGGEANYLTNSDGWAVIVGGFQNTITGGQYGTIGGGKDNVVGGGPAGTVAGGESNYVLADDATIGGGAGNSITNGGGLYATIAGGSGNIANTAYSCIPGGFQAKTSSESQFAHANGKFSVEGDAQTSVYVARETTTNSTPTQMLNDIPAVYIYVPLNSSWTFDILVVGRSSGGNSGHYHIRGAIKNNSGTTSIVGTPVYTVVAEDVGSWDVSVSADNTNDALVINVTGDDTTIQWVASVRTVETVY